MTRRRRMLERIDPSPADLVRVRAEWAADAERQRQYSNEFGTCVICGDTFPLTVGDVELRDYAANIRPARAWQPICAWCRAGGREDVEEGKRFRDVGRTAADVSEVRVLHATERAVRLLRLMAAHEWQPMATCPPAGLFLVYEDGAVRVMYRSAGEWQATAVAVDQWGAAVDGVRVRETGVYEPALWRPIEDLLEGSRRQARPASD
jgi:hypothetical protein